MSTDALLKQFGPPVLPVSQPIVSKSGGIPTKYIVIGGLGILALMFFAGYYYGKSAGIMQAHVYQAPRLADEPLKV
jgi:hypothetical protein